MPQDNTGKEHNGNGKAMPEPASGLEKAVSADERQELSGTVTRIVYRSEDTGYTVCAIRPNDPSQRAGAMDMWHRSPGEHKGAGPGRDEVMVVGNCAALWIGESLKTTGTWTNHPRHGRQFKAEHITCIAPVSAEGIRAYLASGMIKGIGEVTANRMVDTFGDDTLRVIDKESARLSEVQGIGRKTLQKIRESWKAQQSARDIMIFLRGHGIGAGQAARIHRQYGSDAIAVVTKNPYSLCQDVWGIGFKTADKIAGSLGIPPESEIRARAGILYVIQTMSEEGHCFCPWEVLLEEGQALLNIPTEILDNAVKYEVEQRQLIEEGGNVYLAAIHNAEVSIARKINLLMETSHDFPPIDVDRALPWAEKQMKISFAPFQAEALKMALTEKVSIITGGPGVGKTTIIRALVDVFRKRGLTVSLAAPTGRAAKRLAEATRSEAKTLHRLLEFQPRNATFLRGPDLPLESRVFVLDEVSMIDTPLMNHFVRALAPRSHLVLVGDSDQLPSVGPGNILKDMIASGAIPSKRLDTIFRQRHQSWIVVNAHRVNSGQSLELPPPDDLSDFYFINEEDPEKIIASVLNLMTKRIPARFGLNPRTDVQVLTPMRKNQLGAENLNTLLQNALNPVGPSLSRLGMIYRAGDRVMQIRNNYDKEVFNGDIGIIDTLDAENRILSVNFEGKFVDYKTEELDELDLAYACSIHKAQGSEYPAVIVLLATQHFKLLQRNLLYTAITRGRKLVCLVGSNKAVYIAIRNNDTIMRRTSLAKRLGGRTVQVEPVEN
ncbi:MAG: ATP-dependent RecD-like DNA helicase [bacterium]